LASAIGAIEAVFCQPIAETCDIFAKSSQIAGGSAMFLQQFTLVRFVRMAVAALVPAVCLLDQVEQGTITGVISDQTGAVMPGAIARATNRSTQVKAETLSNESGAYRLPFLNVGEYGLTAEKQGFDTTRVENIRLTVALTATVNLLLKTGSVQQEVTVVASAVQLEQQSAALGQVVSATQMAQLPLLGRNPYSLVLLAPGVLPKGGAGAGPIINGGRSNTSEIRARRRRNAKFDHKRYRVHAAPGNGSGV
jgi:hypothetical protein